MGNLTYEEFINNILETRGRFNCGDGYHERHHIVPKCVNGDDDEGNLIDLFAREHFIAHKLLAQENPNNNSLVYAYSMMAFIKNDYQERYELTSEEYEEARKSICGVPKSEEHKQKMRENHADVSGENNPFFGKHHTEETKEKIGKESKKRSLGENNPFFGKHHTEETRKAISKKAKERNAMEHNPRSKRVYCPELDKEFWGAKEAENKYGISHQHISACCRGLRKHAGRHPTTGVLLSWKFVENI